MSSALQPPYGPRRPSRPWLLAVALLPISVGLLLLGLAVGSTGWQSLAQLQHDASAWQIVVDIRLPRSIGAWLAGGLLGLAGALAQGLFRNPLADPYLLGSASGALLGIALDLLALSSGAIAPQMLWLHVGSLNLAAFLGALFGVMLTLALARGVEHSLRLLLAGVIVGVVLGALGSLISLARPEVLQNLQAFALGNTAFIDWTACLWMALAWLVCLLLAWLAARGLDALSLGEDTARSLGLPLHKLRLLLVALLALATGTAVAQTGLIAFVGLAAPHLVRSLVRPTHRYLLPLASLMGAVLLLGSDIVARSLIAPQEVPVGVLTAVLGGSYLLWLMHRGQRRIG